MSLCHRLRQWIQKHQKPGSTPYHYYQRDIYNPIPFEKILRNYDHPAVSRSKSQPHRNRSKSKLLSPIKEKQKICQLKNQKQDVVCQNQILENQNINFSSHNELEREENLLSENSEIIQPQFHQMIMNSIEQQDHSQQPFFDLVQKNVQADKNMKRYSDCEDDKENIQPNIQVEINEKNIPNIKTKISVRMLGKKLKKGTSFRKLAQEVQNRRKIELDGFIHSPDEKVVYEAILAFLQQEFEKNSSQ